MSGLMMVVAFIVGFGSLAFIGVYEDPQFRGKGYKRAELLVGACLVLILALTIAFCAGRIS